jgi:hypothetical protein
MANSTHRICDSFKGIKDFWHRATTFRGGSQRECRTVQPKGEERKKESSRFGQVESILRARERVIVGLRTLPRHIVRCAGEDC